MRFDLKPLFQFTASPSPDSWHMPFRTPGGEYSALPTGVDQLTVYSKSERTRIVSSFRVPPVAHVVALHPTSKLIAYVDRDHVIAVDSKGTIRASAGVGPARSEIRSLSFHPSGSYLFMTIGPVEGQADGEPELIALAFPSLEVVGRLPLEGDPEGLHTSTWLEPNDLLQVEVNAGTNGFTGNFIRFTGGVLDAALPSFDAGEGPYLRLLADNESVLEVLWTKTMLRRIDSSVIAEVDFRSGMRAHAVRPGFCSDLLVIPTQGSDEPGEEELLVIDTTLKYRESIPLPNEGGFASVWCEGCAILAEKRSGGDSAFFGWEII